MIRVEHAMKPKNGTIAKIAGVVIGGVALLWIGWVSSAIVRAEVRESRLVAVEKMVNQIQTSVKDLADIRDSMKDQNKALEDVIKKLEEKAKGGQWTTGP